MRTVFALATCVALASVATAASVNTVEHGTNKRGLEVSASESAKGKQKGGGHHAKHAPAPAPAPPTCTCVAGQYSVVALLETNELVVSSDYHDHAADLQSVGDEGDVDGVNGRSLAEIKEMDSSDAQGRRRRRRRRPAAPTCSCVSCTNKPANGRYTGSGGVSNTCPWTCEGSTFKSGATCQACADCVVGQTRSSCGGASSGTCSACTNKPDTAVYTGHGGQGDTCSWSCNDGSFKSGNSCTVCADCDIGSFKENCKDSSAGTCRKCTTGPDGSAYTTHGGATDTCSWTCNEGFYKAGDRCATCSVCTIGQYRRDCQSMDGGHCASCTDKPEGSEYTTHGGIADDCDWECNEGSYRDGNSCKQCAACPLGQFRNSCTGNDPGTCVSCSSDKPANSDYAVGFEPTNADCSWECKATYYRSGLQCKNCEACPIGQWRTECGGMNVGECSPCTNSKPEHSTYTTWGHTDNKCFWGCDDGFHEKDGACVACADCAVGSWRQNCQAKSAGECKACTNGLVANAHFSSFGGLANECPFTCDDTFYLEGDVCAQCKFCNPGFYRKNCGVSSEGTCAMCDNTLPAHARHTAHHGFSNTCPWECKEGFYKDGAQCIACAACEVGEWRDTCGGGSPGVCKDCTNAVPEHSMFSAHGGRVDKCPWSCDEVFFQDGDACLLCEVESPRCPHLPTPCKVSEWTEWTECTEKCGGGTADRTRTVIQEPRLYGMACPALAASQSCNTNTCGMDSWTTGNTGEGCPPSSMKAVEGFQTAAECTSLCDLDTECTGSVAVGVGEQCKTTDGITKCTCNIMVGDCPQGEAAPSLMQTEALSFVQEATSTSSMSISSSGQLLLTRKRVLTQEERARLRHERQTTVTLEADGSSQRIMRRAGDDE